MIELFPVATKILVVDDSRLDRLSVRRSLNRYSDKALEIEEETCGRKLLENWDLSQIDGLFLDLHLADMTAMEVIGEIQSKYGLVPCPIIVVTGSSFEDLGIQCIEKGAHDYISKDRLSEPTLWRAFNYAQSRHLIRKEMAERTRELERLNRELESKSLLKTEFLASATHELRTPVSAIIGLVELLQSEDLNARSKDYVSKIGISCTSLKNAINDVLDLSKIEAGEFQSHYSEFSPRDLLAGVLESLRVLLGDKPIELKMETEGLAELMGGDARRIHQLLTNFASNALKFTPQGSILISARCLKEDPKWVHFEVRDTGCGIEEHETERVFERHFQGSNQDLEGAELGTGLGLSIVREIVNQLGGTCGCSSRRGEGSRFWFELELQIIEGKPKTRKVAGAVSGNPSVRRILLAEDNHILSQVFKTQVEALGHEIETSSNGVEALEKFEPSRFDIVVLDARMPIKGGIETGLTIRELYPEWPGPIYLLTADATLSARDCGERGLTKVLIKPISTEDLKLLLELTHSEVSLEK